MRIVVLNSHLHLLSKFDRVLILENGNVAAFASPTDLLSHHEAVYRRAVGSISSRETGACEDKNMTTPLLNASALLLQASVGVEDCSEDAKSIGDFSASSAAVVMAAEEKKRRARSASGSGHAPSMSDASDDQPSSAFSMDIPAMDETVGSNSGVAVAAGLNSKGEDIDSAAVTSDADNDKPTGGQLITAEQRTHGAVSFRTVASYFGAFVWNDDESASRGSYGQLTSAGALAATSVFMAFAVTQSMRVIAELELMSWAGRDNGKKNSPYFVGYVVSIAVYTSCVFLSAKLLILFSVRSASKIHKMMFRHVLNAPINLFFDVQTVGSMLNRFAKDLETIDVNIPEYTFMMLNQLFVIMSVLILCVWSVPPFLLVSTPLCAALVLTGRRFICISRDLKRLEAVSRSPIYSSFSETLSGLETIRAFGETPRFIAEHAGRMNRNQKLYFHLVMCQTWLTSRMEYGGCCVLVTISVMAVIIRHYAPTSISASRVGLAVVYTLQLTA
jgi:ABC-type multidrug transport system fused ATPase/permease subunit